MHEVVKGFQHRINNPLATISLTLCGAKRSLAGNPSILGQLSCIEMSAKRIEQAMMDFSEAENYEVERVGHVIGNVASPLSLEHSARWNCTNG